MKKQCGLCHFECLNSSVGQTSLKRENYSDCDLGWYASGTRFSATQSHPCGPPDAPDVPCRYDEGEIFGVEGSTGKAPAENNDMWYFSEMSEVNLQTI